MRRNVDFEQLRAWSHLVHDEHVALLQAGDALVGEIQDAAGRGDHDVHRLVGAHDVVAQRRAAGGAHHLHTHVLAQLLAHLRRAPEHLYGSSTQQPLLGLLLGVWNTSGSVNEAL